MCAAVAAIIAIVGHGARAIHVCAAASSRRSASRNLADASDAADAADRTDAMSADVATSPQLDELTAIRERLSLGRRVVHVELRDAAQSPRPSRPSRPTIAMGSPAFQPATSPGRRAACGGRLLAADDVDRLALGRAASSGNGGRRRPRRREVGGLERRGLLRLRRTSASARATSRGRRARLRRRGASARTTLYLLALFVRMEDDLHDRALLGRAAPRRHHRPRRRQVVELLGDVLLPVRQVVPVGMSTQRTCFGSAADTRIRCRKLERRRAARRRRRRAAAHHLHRPAAHVVEERRAAEAVEVKSACGVP